MFALLSSVAILMQHLDIEELNYSFCLSEIWFFIEVQWNIDVIVFMPSGWVISLRLDHIFLLVIIVYVLCWFEILVGYDEAEYIIQHLIWVIMSDGIQFDASESTYLFLSNYVYYFFFQLGLLGRFSCSGNINNFYFSFLYGLGYLV